MSDEFDQLLPCKWRDIEIPITSVEVSFQQDLAEHKYYGVDGARVEATGRGPMNITITIPFVNGIVPGKNERWQQTLYPGVFRDILRAAADRSVGVFTHPELDEITCRVRSVHFRHDGNRRDGVEMVVQFVETVIDHDTSEIALGRSPIEDATFAAQDLDVSDEDLSALVPDKYELPYTLNDFLDGLSAVGDQFTVQSKLLTGKFDAFVYHLNRLAESITRARDAATWPALDAIEKAKSALRRIKDNPPAGLPILIWFVRADTTLAALISEIPNAEFGDVVKLNPGIMSKLVIPEGTLIRYHDRSK